MDPALDRLTPADDTALILLVGGLYLLAAVTLFDCLARARSGSAGRWLWLPLAAVAAGFGIWAPQVLAALNDGEGQAGPALSALAVAVLLAAAGFAVTQRRRTGTHLWLGGSIAGLAPGAAHTVGTAERWGWAAIDWGDGSVALVCLLGASLAGLALLVALPQGIGTAEAKNARLRTARRTQGVVLFTLAMASPQIVATLAPSTRPGGSPLPIDGGLPVEWLAVAVLLAAVLVLSLSLAGTVSADQGSDQGRDQIERLHRLVNVTFEGLVIHAEGIVLDVNDAIARLTEHRPEELIGSPALDLVAPSFREEARRAIAENRENVYELEILRSDGGTVPVEILGRTFELNGREVRVAAIRDISERREAEVRLHYLAHHDGLTGLPNRSLYRDRLEQDLARARRSGESLAVLSLGLDRFREVNDLYGHETGDRLLRETARRLTAASRETDTVARIGGDEFAIAQPGAQQPNAAGKLADRLLRSLAEPYAIGGQQITIGASVGIAFHPQDGDSPDSLMLQSEKALTRAKADGRGRYRLFEPEMDAKLRERRRFEVDLREAVESGALSLDYQQQVDAGSSAIVGFEALARWRSQKHGEVSPGVFIPLAEETGLILPLGEWVLRQVCRDAVGWPDPIRAGVNLSPLQFKRSDLPKLVAEVLEETGLDPHRLELEITEGVLIDDDERAFGTLRQLKELGVRIAMDDFGTGYSSLSYLQRFPFDKIKIDQSFIRDLEKRPDAMAIVRAVIGLGRSLDVSVIAEGVETETEVELLRREGCQELQGYYFGRPVSLDKVHELLRAEAADKAPKLSLVGS